MNTPPREKKIRIPSPPRKKTYVSEETKLGKKLGEGSYANVYALDDERAIKIFKPGRRPEAQEVKVWEELSQKCNSNIVPLLEKIKIANNYRFVMPRCSYTLLDVIENYSTLNLYDILVDLLTSLECIHNAGILYRDIRPDNIFYCNGKWKLGDFSISVKKDLTSLDELMMPVFDKKYELFLAPEVLKTGYEPVSDIYALGQLFKLFFKTSKMNWIYDLMITEDPEDRYTASELLDLLKELKN